MGKHISPYSKPVTAAIKMKTFDALEKYRMNLGVTRSGAVQLILSKYFEITNNEV